MTTDLAASPGTAQVWAAIEHVYEAILVHPFMTGLTDGTLPREAFGRFLVQDGLYLAEYARSLALCAARAGDHETLLMFAQHASTAVQVEQALHGALLDELGIAREAARAAEMSPVCLAYTSFTKQACALGERHEALASVLPCYWIYGQAGKHLVATGSPDPLYQRWIDTYAGEEFDQAVQGALGAVDEAARGLDGPARAAMVRHAAIAARYEWMFWDSPYRGEAWPITV